MPLPFEANVENAKNPSATIRYFNNGKIVWAKIGTVCLFALWLGGDRTAGEQLGGGTHWRVASKFLTHPPP